MKISLIISTYNRPDTLELVLMSVARQKSDNLLTSGDIEILVADDGSTEETANLVRHFQADFPFRLSHVWHEDKGFRLSAIRNLAVSKSTGDYLIFIDGDCILAEDFLISQAKLAEHGYFVGGNRVLLSEKYTQTILLNKSIEIAGTSILQSIFSCMFGKTNKWLPALRLNPTASWRKKHENNWQRPKGCNMAVWRKDYMVVNGFDESFSGWGHEDADFLVRLLHSGIKIKDGRFAVPVYHLWHKMNDRSQEAENKQRLLSRVNDKSLVQAKDGVNKYLN